MSNESKGQRILQKKTFLVFEEEKNFAGCSWGKESGWYVNHLSHMLSFKIASPLTSRWGRITFVTNLVSNYFVIPILHLKQMLKNNLKFNLSWVRLSHVEKQPRAERGQRGVRPKMYFCIPPSTKYLTNSLSRNGCRKFRKNVCFSNW